MKVTHDEVPHCETFFTTHCHPFWTQIFASVFCFHTQKFVLEILIGEDWNIVKKKICNHFTKEKRILGNEDVMIHKAYFEEHIL